jgi:8-oxo-dGTP diphosphatase
MAEEYAALIKRLYKTESLDLYKKVYCVTLDDMKIVEVSAAIVIKDKKVFCAQRPDRGSLGLFWEFPGGKVEPGENPKATVVRELEEEMDTELEAGSLLCTIEHDYETFHLTMHCYLCSVISGEFKLKEHLASRWLDKEQLYSVNWAPADLKILPIIEAYI